MDSGRSAESLTTLDIDRRIERKVLRWKENRFVRIHSVVTLSIMLLIATLVFADPLRITKGPVVEHTEAHEATIAWSTNASSATIVRFGTDPNHLNDRAEMPWGALTHRVTLKHLQPGTTYYFQVDSSQGEGSGSEAVSAVGTFATPSSAQ